MESRVQIGSDDAWIKAWLSVLTIVVGCFILLLLSLGSKIVFDNGKFALTSEVQDKLDRVHGDFDRMDKNERAFLDLLADPKGKEKAGQILKLLSKKK